MEDNILIRYLNVNVLYQQHIKKVTKFTKTSYWYIVKQMHIDLRVL